MLVSQRIPETETNNMQQRKYKLKLISIKANLSFFDKTERYKTLSGESGKMYI